ncbi:MAG: hypothetical protein V1908_03795 [Candidatus Peregrinibacteria bacterium]
MPETIDMTRLDRMIAELEVFKQILEAQGHRDGNREVERTRGAIEALTGAKQALLGENDPTQYPVVGGVDQMRTDYPHLKGRKIMRLRIGDEVVIGAEDSADESIRYEKIRAVQGTRLQVFQAFLEELRKK